MSVPLWALRAGLVAASLVAWFWTQSLLGNAPSPREGSATPSSI